LLGDGVYLVLLVFGGSGFLLEVGFGVAEGPTQTLLMHVMMKV
jgi:hypothetical protein